MSRAHSGTTIGLMGDFILPVSFEDQYLPFYWNTVSGRGFEPTTDISTIVPDDRFGQVLQVDASTTNLWNGNHSISLPEGGATEAGYYSIPTTTHGTYTLSCWVRYFPDDTSTNPRTTFRARYSDGTHTEANTIGNYGYHTKDRKWRKFILTITTNTAKTLQELNGWILDHSTAGAAKHAEAKEIQIEQKAWATAFTPSSRETGDIRYPKEIIPDGDFTINMWIAPTGDTRTMNMDYKLIAFDMNRDISFLTVWNYHPLGTDQRKVITDYGLNDSSVRQYMDLTSSTPFVPDQWEMFTILFNRTAKTFEYYRNGVYWQSTSVAKLHPINYMVLYNSGWKYSGLLITPRIPRRTEIRSWYEYGKQFYDPYNYYAVWG